MAYLTLEDGTIFKGEAFGAKVDIMGEVVFNTGMTGYQEVLTDPSYCGQIVTMTYPMIGNYGIDETISESSGPQVRAFVMRELCKEPSNWNCRETLQEYLERYDIVGLAGIDTRELTRKLRDKGTMHGIITQVPPSVHQIEEMKVFEVERPVDETTCAEKYQYCTGERKVAVLDFGLKRNILRSLEKRGCALTVFPARTDPQEIIAGGFDGLMLTNGPGDPKVNTEIIENLKQLIGKLPIFGICLGHQACGACHGGGYGKIEIRPPGSKSSREGYAEKQGVYYLAESRIYDYEPVTPGMRGRFAQKLERSDD